MKTRHEKITKEDFLLLFSNADEEMKKVMLLSYIGLRLGEISALKYENISEDAITIKNTLILGSNGKWISHTPITGNRTVSFPSYIDGLIGHGNPEDNVVPINPGLIRSKFKKLCKSLNLNYCIRNIRNSAIILNEYCF